MDLFELKASLVYISSRPARTTQRACLSKKRKAIATHITNVYKTKEECWEQLSNNRFVNLKGNRQNVPKLLIKTDPGRNKD